MNLGILQKKKKTRGIFLPLMMQQLPGWEIHEQYADNITFIHLLLKIMRAGKYNPFLKRLNQEEIRIILPCQVQKKYC